MAIAVGTMLGQYEILAQIGAGGMGEVYRAHDHKLERDVAIKVLPEAFARDPERIARFKREAKLLASLNHPNIAAIYDLEDAGGWYFLVMEMVEGETLAEQVRRGPVEVDEALRIAGKIAEALEHAHEKTIIHRDLKPANVKVTPEGKVKVLDFGLAKAFAAETSSYTPLNSNDPTLSATPTIPGAILGTAAYMSPEQARGKTVDKRTDLWALGCVLYELLTARQAFPGESLTDILGAVLHKQPEWSALTASTPATVRSILRRCLEKDRDQRYRSAGDLALGLEDGRRAADSEAPEMQAVIQAQVRPALWHRALPWAAVLVLTVASAIAAWMLKPTAPAAVTRLSIPLAPGEPLTLRPSATFCPQMALSPDGRLLAYVTADANGTEHLYLRSLDSFETRRISGTASIVDSLFFSPDSQWLGFWTDPSHLRKIATSGGAPVPITEGNVCGGSWSPSDTVVFGLNTAEFQEVSAEGGSSKQITTLDRPKGERALAYPEFLPGGKTLLYSIGTTPSADEGQIVAQRLDTGERRVLIQGGSQARYVPTGHLIYTRAGTLLAVPFDPKRLETTGRPVTVLEGLMSTSSGASRFAVSQTGTLAYVPGTVQQGTRLRTLVWVDRKGAETPLPAPPNDYSRPQLSPDGSKLALQLNGETISDIWIYDLTRDTLTRLTFEGNNIIPVWSPDSKRVAFRSNKDGQSSIYWKLADGSGGEERLTSGEFQESPGSFSPDGRTLAFTRFDVKNGVGLWTLPLEGERKPQVLLDSSFNEATPKISPDGRWLAYLSDESGRIEVYVRPFPGPGGMWQISTEGGAEAEWSPKGNELLFRTGAQRERLMAVDILAQAGFASGKPRVVIEGSYASGLALGNLVPFYSIARDGQRFLMIKDKEAPKSTAPTQINVVLNWFEELKQKAPVQ
ncbi:MAG: protein kinase [Acidobacteria bacterium]|nr:protein kinase [Acidobacteriota bacterium]